MTSSGSDDSWLAQFTATIEDQWRRMLAGGFDDEIRAQVERDKYIIQFAEDYERVTRELSEGLGVTDVRVVGGNMNVTILVGCADKPAVYEAGIASALYQFGWADRGLLELVPVGVVVFVKCMRDDAEALRVMLEEREGR